MSIELILGDCLEKMGGIPDGSVDLILTDPTYFRVKDEPWDRQWDTKEGFLCWLGDVLREFRRVLRPNGSLYLFASPQMAARVELTVGDFFHVVNRITWRKPPFATKAEMFRKEDLRSFFPASEAIVFAEQRGSDAAALSEAGYASQCGEVHKAVYGGVFGEYFIAEFARAGVTRKEIAALFPSRTGNLTGCVSNWVLGLNCPTAEQYETIRQYLNGRGGEYLRRDYEDLRRPFTVSADVPYTDVWDFPTVKTYPGKHPCEKPQSLLRHAITVSSRPRSVVLDAFAGTGATGLACLQTDRNFIGIEKDASYYDMACRRIADAQSQPALLPAP